MKSPKISISVFEGVSPITPPHNLNKEVASVVLNTRMDNSAIRALYKAENSAIAFPSTNISPDNVDIVSSAPTNIAWLHWRPYFVSGLPNMFKTSVIESRYNTISAYNYPDIIPLPEGGALTTVFAGPDVLLDAAGYSATSSARYSTHNLLPASYAGTTQITASASPSLNGPETAAWTYVSGDATIVPDASNILNPTFSGTVNMPAGAAALNEGQSLTESITAVWLCTLTDATPDTGTREVSISFTYTAYNPLNLGGGGFNF